MPERSPRASSRRNVVLAAALAAVAGNAPAAETWLHPVLPPAAAKAPAPPQRRGARPARPVSPSYPFPVATSGESSPVELTTGERYPAPGRAVAPEKVDRSFVRLGSGRPMPLTSAKVDGALTRFEATWAGQGLATLGVLLLPEARTVEAAEFEAFLRDSGAAAALADRTKRKETRKPAKVVAIESARAFAAAVAPPRTAPADPAAGTDEPLGLPLEVVSAVPPLPLRSGATLTASVLLDGKPAPGALLRAFAPWSEAPLALTADSQGVVSLPLEGDGRLLLSAASVRRTAKADRSRGEAWKKADWEVRRTTLELLVLPKAVPPPPAPRKKPAPRAKAR